MYTYHSPYQHLIMIRQEVKVQCNKVWLQSVSGGWKCNVYVGTYLCEWSICRPVWSLCYFPSSLGHLGKGVVGLLRPPLKLLYLMRSQMNNILKTIWLIHAVLKLGRLQGILKSSSMLFAIMAFLPCHAWCLLHLFIAVLVLYFFSSPSSTTYSFSSLNVLHCIIQFSIGKGRK